MADKECPNCGRKTRQEASFCLGCGQSFGAAATSRPAVERRPPPERKPPPERRPAPEREAPPSRFDPDRLEERAASYVPRQPATGDRLTIEQRRDIARRRVARDDAENPVESEPAWRRFRPGRFELTVAVAMLPATLLLSVLAAILIVNVFDWLKQDEGAGQVEFAAAVEFDAGRLLTVGMTQTEINTTSFEGVAGWRVVYMDESSAEEASLSAGSVHLTTRDADPVYSPYYVTIAFPMAETGAGPVAAFLRRDDETIFHVMGISCEDALANIAHTTRRGPPPGSIC